jgi:glycosyltransferase involved in cell wall biosynthesis
MEWEQYEKACFLLARNEREYLKDNTFNDRVQSLIRQIPEGRQEEALAFMEAMVSYSPKYEEMEQKYLPILIYKTEPICYGILNHFADRMCEELERLGECVEIFDIAEHPLDDLREWSRKKYKAVLGFQAYLFSIRMVNGDNLHDYFHAPMYNMFLDHPAVMHKHLMNAPKNMTILTHDRNYQEYLRTYYDGYVETQILLPGGEGYKGTAQKEYALTFVGSYHNWRNWIPALKDINRKTHGLARKLVHEMRHHPNDTYEACFERILTGDRLDYSIEQKRDILYECQSTYCCVMNYYREQIIKIILESGLELHVFGDTWREPCWEQYSNLIIHSGQEGEAALKLYAQSEVSLNIMSWHKDGMTERIANMMLNRTVVVTDGSRYLKEHYQDGRELLFYDLEHLEELPGMIRTLLENREQRESIVQQAYKRAVSEDTWGNRAEEFLRILNGME